MTLYMILGMVVAFIQILKNEESQKDFNPGLSRWKRTAALEMASLVVVYVFVGMRTF